jgi:hypothetical protein
VIDHDADERPRSLGRRLVVAAPGVLGDLDQRVGCVGLVGLLSALLSGVAEDPLPIGLERGEELGPGVGESSASSRNAPSGSIQRRRRRRRWMRS